MHLLTNGAELVHNASGGKKKNKPDIQPNFETHTWQTILCLFTILNNAALLSSTENNTSKLCYQSAKGLYIWR